MQLNLDASDCFQWLLLQSRGLHKLNLLCCIAGQGRVFQCLQENIAKSGFGEQCQVEVQKREARMQDDYRLDYGIASQCEADVEQLCSLEKVWCGENTKKNVETQDCNCSMSI